MWYKNLIFLILSLTCFSSFAQTKGNSKGKTDTWSTLGFDFYIGGGIYMADKSTANYYNGAPENEVNLNLLFDNSYRFDEITLLIQNNYSYVDSIWLGDYPKDMSYKIGSNFGLGVKYKLNKNWGICLNYSTVSLSANDVFMIMFDVVPGNERSTYALENISIKEERSFFDLNVSRLFHVNPVIKPFLEIGLQFNYLKVKSFQAVIEDKTYDLLSSVSSVYVPGQQTTTNYRNWAAPGYGASITGGVKIVFNETFSLDPALTFSVSSFGHSDNLYGFFTGLTFNYNLMIRLVMSDLYFNKK
jgi:hypothetical protein